MLRNKYILLLSIILLPFTAFALEPIFKLKGQTIMLAATPTTIGVIYDANALSSNDFSNKFLSNIDFAGKIITVSNVNVIDWDKKSQALIVEFGFEGKNYCFYFPQNIKTSHVRKKKPYTLFYSGTFMDSYQNTDESHFVTPKNICISYWLASDIEFFNSKKEAKFKWGGDSETTFVFMGFDPQNQKYIYRSFVEGEIKPANSETRTILPRKTIEHPYNTFTENDAIERVLRRLYWAD